MTNTNLLKAKIKELGLTQEKTAEKIGISKVSFNYKLNNKREFTAYEILKLSEALKIENKESYFFARM